MGGSSKKVTRWLSNKINREQESGADAEKERTEDGRDGAVEQSISPVSGEHVDPASGGEIGEESSMRKMEKRDDAKEGKTNPSSNVLARQNASGEQRTMKSELVSGRATSEASDPSSSSTVASHPVSPSPSKSTRRAMTTPVTYATRTNAQGETIQTHIRKVTADLADMLDSMSSTTSPASSSKDLAIFPTADGVAPRSRTFGPRGDSVTTMVDLEAASNDKAKVEVVPAHHVRKLTNTMVDILRSMAGTNGYRNGEADALSDAQALMGECGSEISVDTSSEKLSLSSASNKDSDISATTALLKAQFMPQQEYRGDDVRPFYMDRPDDYLNKLDEIAGSCAGNSDEGEEEEEDNDNRNEEGKCGKTDTKEELDSAVAEYLDSAIPKRLIKNTRFNWIGLSVFVFFCCALIIYIGIRSAKTLGLGPSLWYGVIVLLVEILGGLAMLPYGLCLTRRVDDPVPPAIEAATKGQSATTILNYHVRVVIPCYKEPLEVVSKTFMAAMYATLPVNCCRTVYLLDDGRDADKRRFVRSLGLPNAVYVSGRKRQKGEMNGKSANINNAMKLIYPDGVTIPLDEVICVFDADQVPNADFFSKTVPLLDGGQDVAMVLTPQTFYNLNPNGDIFNHANVHFWDYTQPGYDALGLISCTGTNFLLRSRAFHDAGWFPEWTLTEDFALGIELKRRGWQCRYVDQYLAVGEAPDEVRNCFQQRSRWAKGHFQVFFGRGRNPAFGRGSKGLSFLMRWMYGSVVLSYFSAFFATPLLMLVPIITVWFGAFPIVINFWAALSITIYYGATLALMYYTRMLGHLKSMWFASVSNSILWFAYLKAMYRATIGRWLSGTIVFKVTAKGLQKLNNLPLRDIWMATIWFIFSIVTLVFGLVHFFKGQNWDTPLAISIIFMVYNLIPQYLLLQYATFRPMMLFNIICKICMLLSTAMAIMGIALIWALYPRSYNLNSALSSSIYFMDTQRVGQLPDNFRVSWRRSSFPSEASSLVYLATNPNDTLMLGTFGDSFGSGFDDFSADPFGGQVASGSGVNPFAPDPFAGRRRRLQQESAFTAAFNAAAAEENPWAAATDELFTEDAPTTDSETSGQAEDPFAIDSINADGGAGAADPFAIVSEDPLAGNSESDTGSEDILGPENSVAEDPFAASVTPDEDTAVLDSEASADPFGDPVGAASSNDPFADAAGDPFAVDADADATNDPFAVDGAADSTIAGTDAFAANDPFGTDPFAVSESDSGFGGDPFDPFATDLSGDFSFGDELELATEDVWDLSGGWLTGMKAGNMKATGPLAFATTLQAWGYMSFQDGFTKAGQSEALLDSVRWGADYLSKLYRFNAASNTSLIISRVGDVDTEMLLWYRPEDQSEPRDAFAVDLNSEIGGYGADLGGSVTAGLASASIIFSSTENDEDRDYGAKLLDRAQEVYKVARLATLTYSQADYNMSVLYNSTSVYDDLAWAAGWMYKATRDEAYLSDMYDFYVKHLQFEGEATDWKYAFDWDNVFWPLNVLMAQETGKGTFKDQSELFLKSWICADNAAIYTRRGRAFNPMTASLGSTANAGMLALMYADLIRSESYSASQTYKCWALSQIRYVLGDAGRSLVVGEGHNPPKRTQDRTASCPEPPGVCNRVTGLLSPDPDSYSLDGALVYGPGNSDDFLDIRNNDAALIGVENNAGFIGALAGAVLLPSGMWEVCLQEFGIYRSNPVCGTFVTL